MTKTPDAAEHLRQWLESEGLTVTTGADNRVLDVVVPGSEGRTIRVVELAETGLLHLSMLLDVQIHRRRWAALYPLLSDVNARMAFGAWAIDPESGIVYYRVAIPARGVSYEAQALRDVFSHVASLVGATEAELSAVAVEETTDDPILSAWADEPDEH